MQSSAGVRKSGNGKGYFTSKGRQLGDVARSEAQAPHKTPLRKADRMIEFLRFTQDTYRYFAHAHLRALAKKKCATSIIGMPTP